MESSRKQEKRGRQRGRTTKSHQRTEERVPTTRPGIRHEASGAKTTICQRSRCGEENGEDSKPRRVRSRLTQMPTVQTYRRPIRKLVIVTVAGLFLVHASPQASAQEATAVLLRIARSLTTGSVPRPRFARLGPGRRSRRRSRTLANRHGSGSPMASLKVRQPQRGPRETAPRSTLLEPAQRLRGRVVVDAEVPGDGRDADALIPHLGRLGGDPLVHRDGDTSTQLNLNRDFGQGAKPLRTCPIPLGPVFALSYTRQSAPIKSLPTPRSARPLAFRYQVSGHISAE